MKNETQAMFDNQSFIALVAAIVKKETRKALYVETENES